MLIEHRWAAGLRDTLVEAGYVEKAVTDQAGAAVIDAALIQQAITNGAD